MIWKPRARKMTRLCQVGTGINCEDGTWTCFLLWLHTSLWVQSFIYPYHLLLLDPPVLFIKSELIVGQLPSPDSCLTQCMMVRRRQEWIASDLLWDNSILLMASLCCSTNVHSLPLCGKKFTPHKSTGTSSSAQLQPRTLSKSLEVHFHILFRVFLRGLCWNYFQACSICLPMEKEQVSS